MALTFSKSPTLDRLIGKRLKNAGETMYHAATGVTDGNEQNKKKRDKVRKAFARYRGYSNQRMDEGTHHYGRDETTNGIPDK